MQSPALSFARLSCLSYSLLILVGCSSGDKGQGDRIKTRVISITSELGLAQDRLS